MVLRRDIDVIDIEQNSASASSTTSLRNSHRSSPRHETPHSCSRSRRRLALRKSRVSRIFCASPGGGECVWHWQQIVGVASVHASQHKWSESQGVFVRLTRRLSFLRWSRLSLSADQNRSRLRAARRGIVPNRVQHLEGRAVDHEVFRDDLEPIHDGLFLQNVAVVRDA